MYLLQVYKFVFVGLYVKTYISIGTFGTATFARWNNELFIY